MALLTDSKIRSAKPLAKSYKLTDSQGLYLMVSISGSRLWYFRYRFGGKENRLAFGAYPQVTLAEARAKRKSDLLFGIRVFFMAMCLSLRWKKDRMRQFRLVLFPGRRSIINGEQVSTI
jgi:hypothetical protein